MLAGAGVGNQLAENPAGDAALTWYDGSPDAAETLSAASQQHSATVILPPPVLQLTGVARAIRHGGPPGPPPRSAGRGPVRRPGRRSA